MKILETINVQTGAVEPLKPIKLRFKGNKQWTTKSDSEAEESANDPDYHDDKSSDQTPKKSKRKKYEQSDHYRFRLVISNSHCVLH